MEILCERAFVSLCFYFCLTYQSNLFEHKKSTFSYLCLLRLPFTVAACNLM